MCFIAQKEHGMLHLPWSLSQPKFRDEQNRTPIGKFSFAPRCLATEKGPVVDI